VVDQEKEPCRCPPAAPKGNEFPLAQSEGLAPLPKPAGDAAAQPGAAPETATTLAYNSAEHATPTAEVATPAAGATEKPTANPPAAKKKAGFFAGIGRFFRRLFGAE
jgi:hypothetical protein